MNELTNPGRTSSSAILAMGIITWAALLLQLFLSIRLSLANGMSVLHGVGVYFGFFTILTNLFVALILTFTLSSVQSRIQRFFTHPQVLASAATSILLVSLGYHFLLRELWDPQGLQWVADMALHYLTPLGFGILWVFRLQKSVLPWWSPIVWCAYPLIYFCYALIRGELLELYPYPFIDVGKIGYAVMLRNAFGLFVAFIIVGSMMVALVYFTRGRRMRHEPFT